MARTKREENRFRGKADKMMMKVGWKTARFVARIVRYEKQRNPLWSIADFIHRSETDYRGKEEKRKKKKGRKEIAAISPGNPSRRKKRREKKEKKKEGKKAKRPATGCREILIKSYVKPDDISFRGINKRGQRSITRPCNYRHRLRPSTSMSTINVTDSSTPIALPFTLPLRSQIDR